MIKVLLIEDDQWLAESERDVLVKAGYRVTVASNALVAMELLDSNLPDVVVLDVLLAGSTGFSLLNELQSHADTRSIPVVLCTNLAEQFSGNKLKEYGVMRVVDKTTMHPDDVVAAVKAVLV